MVACTQCLPTHLAAAFGKLITSERTLRKVEIMPRTLLHFYQLALSVHGMLAVALKHTNLMCCVWVEQMRAARNAAIQAWACCSDDFCTGVWRGSLKCIWNILVWLCTPQCNADICNAYSYSYCTKLTNKRSVFYLLQQACSAWFLKLCGCAN